MNQLNDIIKMLQPEQWQILLFSLIPLFLTAHFYKHHRTKTAEWSFFTSMTASLCAFASVMLSGFLILAGLVMFGLAQFPMNQDKIKM